jgi:hypothetical protein
MSVFEIPLSPAPQTFSISLSGVDYQLTVRWNVVAAAWTLDVADTAGEPIVVGIPIVTGVDLLEQYAYLNLGGKLIAQSDNTPDAVPTFANLGAGGRLYWVVA